MINPEQLKHIILSSDYANLKTLNLSNRELEDLPEEIELLVNLQELDLSYNKFTQIPKSIFKLKNLEILYLHRNEIQYVSGEFRNFSKLHTLDLSFNAISHVDENIGYLNALQYLDLSHNQLTSLPVSLVKLTNIKRMYLEENAFSFPPADIVNRGLYSVMFYLLHHGVKTSEQRMATELAEVDTTKKLFDKYVQSFLRFLEKLTGKSTQIEWQMKDNHKLNLSPEELKKINIYIQNIPDNLLAAHDQKKELLDDLKKVRDSITWQINKIETSKGIEN